MTTSMGALVDRKMAFKLQRPPRRRKDVGETVYERE